jgi:hypothetical protein
MKYLLDLLCAHLVKKAKSAMNSFCENYNKRKHENKKKPNQEPGPNPKPNTNPKKGPSIDTGAGQGGERKRDPPVRRKIGPGGGRGEGGV